MPYQFDYFFTKGGAPIVTCSSIGLAFNAGARSMLQYPKQVDIGYDEASNAIGVRPHDTLSNAPCYEFETRVKDNWVRLSMRDFMKYLAQRTGIDFRSKAIQFIPTIDEESGMLVIIVDEAHRK